MAGNGWINPIKPRACGFSLLEAFVALTVLLVGIGGVAASFQAQISNSVAARNQAQAAIIAQSVLSELSDSNPAEWDVEIIQEGFLFDFEGNKVEEEGQAYYRVDLSETANPLGWWDVTIGIIWDGWQVEQEKTGSGNSNTHFAYALEASVAPYIAADDDDEE